MQGKQAVNSSFEIDQTKYLKGFTPKQKVFELKLAIFQNNLKRVEQLVQAGVSFTLFEEQYKLPPAHVCLAYGKIDIFRFLKKNNRANTKRCI